MLLNRKWVSGIVVCTAFSMLLACSNKAGSSDAVATKEPSKVTEGSQSEPYKLPFVEPGTATLRVASGDNLYAPNSYAQGTAVWDEFEKLTGVKIEWEVFPNSQYVESMGVRLAAARNLPDIFRLVDSPVKTASDGLIMPLNDLIAEHAPNIQQLFKDNPDMERMMTAPDGNIYSIHSNSAGAYMADPFGILIRKDWLDELGLKEPETLDQWYEVLKAFKTGDPNKNGKPDEIPISPEYSLKGLGLFGSAMGLHLFVYSDGYYPNKSEVIEYHWIKDEAKTFIEWLNKLYSEGLIDPNFMNNSYEQIDSGISRDLIGTTVHFVNNVNRFNGMQKDAGVAADWVITNPPSGPGHEPFYELGAPLGSGWAISKDAKDPVLAMKWLDYIYASEAGNRLVTFGIEGVSYEMKDGKPQFTDWTSKHPDGLSFNEALRSLGAMPNMPWLRMMDGPFSLQPQAILDKDPALSAQVSKVKEYLVPSNPVILDTPEEAEELARLNSEVETYVSETLLKFVTGQTPIDWEKFVSTTKALGMDRILEIKQQKYERYLNQ
ncbi:hypothetical protein B1748_19130 [Paenibacillus sp. MY03]|uniref:extracellular solute-binding protein n=1 Tax=Paenibacillus sp. MY03 TaxID=302980 RepID=UPI000B3D4B6B|nr:extracellular solute-binding protein [Paenibacillus sp. MY03]OUS75017.1 hypothetical protein B1748_19130 [Paenibacillus sp. MY03]